MTDKDIIQVLQYIVENGSCACDKCPVFPCGKIKDYEDNQCGRFIAENALDLINRQKAEIEELKEERDMAVKDIYCSTKCFICKNMPSDGNMTHCPNYSSCGLAYIYFKWRGENNGKKD